jgi:hypothetical protein
MTLFGGPSHGPGGDFADDSSLPLAALVNPIRAQFMPISTPLLKTATQGKIQISEATVKAMMTNRPQNLPLKNLSIEEKRNPNQNRTALQLRLKPIVSASLRSIQKPILSPMVGRVLAAVVCLKIQSLNVVKIGIKRKSILSMTFQLEFFR